MKRTNLGDWFRGVRKCKRVTGRYGLSGQISRVILRRSLADVVSCYPAEPLAQRLTAMSRPNLGEWIESGYRSSVAVVAERPRLDWAVDWSDLILLEDR